MAYPVKWFTSDMTGAPVLGQNVQGSLIAILKACLIDGFGELNPTSITYSAGSLQCTATFAAPHGYRKHSIILVSDANEAAFNGEVRVISSTVDTIVWEPETTPPATATTGTVFKTRVAPATGWQIAYEDPGNYLIILERTAPNATPYKVLIKNDQDYMGSTTYNN